MEIMEYSEYQYIATVWLPISVNMPTTCAIWRFTGILVVYPKSIPLGQPRSLEDLLLISPSPAQNHLLSMFAEFVAPMGSNLLSATVGNSRQCFRIHSPLDSSAHAINFA